MVVVKFHDRRRVQRDHKCQVVCANSMDRGILQIDGDRVVVEERIGYQVGGCIGSAARVSRDGVRGDSRGKRDRAVICRWCRAWIEAELVRHIEIVRLDRNVVGFDKAVS